MSRRCPSGQQAHQAGQPSLKALLCAFANAFKLCQREAKGARAMIFRGTIEYEPNWSAEDRAGLGLQELKRREEGRWANGEITLPNLAAAVIKYELTDDDMPPPIRAAHMEELRFWKKQQWAVAGAAIALIAGAIPLSQNMKPLACWEKAVASLLVLSVAGGGGWLIWRLQKSLRDTRLVLYPTDPDPKRGKDVVIVLWGALLISAVAVIYSVWRSQAYAALPY
jgi:hypothetical protein